MGVRLLSRRNCASISVGGNDMNIILNITSGFCESCVSYPTTNTALALSAFCVFRRLYGR